jgi:predicted Zn-dependent protease
MGGFVYVHTGLLKEADNEAQLASVIAHEMGHIAARHAVKKMRENLVAQGVAQAAGVDRNILVNAGVQLAIQRPKSRQFEFEADQRGLKTIGRSGYAESGMVDFMKKLLKQGSPPTFLSDHPATGDRVTALQNALDPSKANGEGLDNDSYKSLISSIIR